MTYDREAMARWRAKHREEYNAYHREHFRKHREAYYARMKAWRDAHPEYKIRKREYQREWCRKRREKGNDES